MVPVSGVDNPVFLHCYNWSSSDESCIVGPVVGSNIQFVVGSNPLGPSFDCIECKQMEMSKQLDGIQTLSMS